MSLFVQILNGNENLFPHKDIENVKEYVETFPNAKQEEYTDMKEAVQGANVLYVTRVQKERFETEADYEKVKVSVK